MHPLARKLLHQDRLPEPAISLLLRQRRRAVAGELLVREAGEIGRVATLWEHDRPAGRDALAALAERLVAEHRAEVARRSRGPLSRVAAAVDRRMPTDTVELMDRADVAETTKVRIISDLERIQDLIGTYERLIDVARPYLPVGGRLSVLDVASGHGGLPVWLATHAERLGLQIDVTASDIEPAFLAHARDNAAAAGVTVQTRVLDALDMDVAPGAYDLVTCTAAIHHLGHGRVAVLLAEAARVARRGVVFLDGYRSPTQLGVAVAAFAATGSARASIHDCAVSVRKMYVPEELALIAACTPGVGRVGRAEWLPPGWVALHAPGTAG